MIAIADSQVRSRIQKSLPEDTKYFSFIDPSAIFLDRNIVIGDGSFIGANCVITTNVKIGNHSILNRNVNNIYHNGSFLKCDPNKIMPIYLNDPDETFFVHNRLYPKVLMNMCRNEYESHHTTTFSCNMGCALAAYNQLNNN
jgi:hypothetical protein